MFPDVFTRVKYARIGRLKVSFRTGRAGEFLMPDNSDERAIPHMA
jgi:hypothetical protein